MEGEIKKIYAQEALDEEKRQIQLRRENHIKLNEQVKKDNLILQ